jgi:hypothetical protein
MASKDDSARQLSNVEDMTTEAAKQQDAFRQRPAAQRPGIEQIRY